MLVNQFHCCPEATSDSLHARQRGQRKPSRPQKPYTVLGESYIIPTTPRTNRGALPAHVSPGAWTTMLGSRPVDCARFKPPAVHGGSVRPKPAVQIATVDPGAAGFDGPFMAASPLIGAACDEAADKQNFSQVFGCNDVAPALIQTLRSDTVSARRTGVETPGTGPNPGSLDAQAPAPHAAGHCISPY
jgi:hypothetical protein